MRKVKYFTHKENIMNVVVLEMNGERVSKTLSYLPSHRAWYNVVAKGQKMIRTATAEEAVEAASKLGELGAECAYIKVPSQFNAVNLSSLRIA